MPHKEIKNKMNFNKFKIHLCAFADSRYIYSQERLMWQTQNMKTITKGFHYDESDLPDAIFGKLMDYLKPGIPGFGFWIWKPYIILDALKRIKNGDVLLYLDTGCYLNKKGKMRFMEYCKTVAINDSGFLVTNTSRNHFECFWTKGDIFDFFNVRDNKIFTDTPQYQAGTIFIRKQPDTVRLIEEWFSICLNHFHLIDDSPSVSPNLPGFRENRHDQSILSLLLKQHGTSVIPIEECWTAGDWSKLVEKSPILQIRDLI